MAVTRVVAAGTEDLDSPRGWVVVASAFLSVFVVYGIVYSFGAFFDSMAEDFGTGKGATALMFSITTALYFGLGVVSGKAVDRFGPRPLLLIAAGMLGVVLVEEHTKEYGTDGPVSVCPVRLAGRVPRWRGCWSDP